MAGRKEPAKRRPTIHDVAKLANASTAAVSRVLRDAYGVSDKMTIRVERAVKELGYRPLAAARGMRGKTYTIGIVHPDLRNTFYPDIITAMVPFFLPTKRQLLFATTEWTSPEEVLAAMHDRQVEGVILISPTMSEAKLAEAARKTPIVLTHRHSKSKSYDTLVDDDDAGAAMVVRHLAELGHRKIAHLGPGKGKLATSVRNIPARRARAYKNAMENIGLADFIQVLDGQQYSVECGYQVAKRTFEMPNRPTAIFAGTDDVAFGIIQAAFEAGLRIPEDLSLVGYDNTQISALAPISLTTVDQDPVAIGVKAANLLLSRIAGRTISEHHVFLPKLVVRRSTAPPGN